MMGFRSACALMSCLLLASCEGLDELTNSRETYAVYSAILAYPPLSHPDLNSKYLIAAITDGQIQTPRNACAVPQVSSESLAQIISNFRLQKNAPVHLKREFALPKPYVLLSSEQATEYELRQFVPRIETDPPISPPENLYGGADLIRLSDVFFNSPRNVATVYVSAYCGGLCGLWGWHILEKDSKSRWREIPGAKCNATIS